MKKLFSVTILTLCITLILVYSCDKDKEKSIVGPGEDTYTISGRVIYNSNPLGNITIFLIGSGIEKSSMTDSLGMYTFDGLPAGDYTLAPSIEVYNFYQGIR